MEILNYPKKVEMIFKASDYNYKAEAFHEKCDNINDTLIILRTEFNKTIGGFTHHPWKSP